MPDKRSRCPDTCPRKAVAIHSPLLVGRGPKTAKILLVGEAPGQNEDRDGKPFIGTSGQLLTDALLEVGINRKEVYITNAVKCATPDENVKPGNKEIKSCRCFLEKEIAIIQPNVIGVLGGVALEAVLKRRGITKLQNNIFFSEEFNAKVIPVVHPAYVLRNPGVADTFMQGIELIKLESKAKAVLEKKEKIKHIDAATPEDIDEVLNKLENVPGFVCDLETSSLNYLEAKILCIALSWKDGLGVTIKWDSLSTAQLAKFKKILLSDKTKINHNIKYDLQVFLANEIKVKGPFFDTLLAVSLLDENMREKALDACTLRYLDLGEYWAPLEAAKVAIAKEKGIKKDEVTYDMFEYPVLCKYAQCDADATYRLYNIFKKQLADQNLQTFMDMYSIPTMQLLSEMEFRGILVDREKLAELIKEYEQKREEARKDVHADPVVKKYEKFRMFKVSKKIVAKWEKAKTLKSRFPNVEDYIKKSLKDKDWQFNEQSPKQLQEILFKDILRLTPTKFSAKTKEPSTDVEVLTDLADRKKIKIAQSIMNHRKIAKFISTYLVSTYEKSAYDGRVHASYLQHQAVTGRLACHAPNMQNIQRDAYNFKECFVADPGYTFVKGDLAQAEFRCWAHYANDADMISDIESGLDIHRHTAAGVFGVSEDDVTDEQRTAAKNCVAGDTWIPTDSGFKHIRDIKEGDIVLDHLNRKQKVLEIITKEDTLYLLETECGSLKCTLDHPFYIIDQNADLITKPLSALSAGDYILSCTPKKNNKRKFLHNVNKYYQENHPDIDVRYGVKRRKHITHAFIKKYCLGINKTIDTLVNNSIYSVIINTITKLDKDTVHDFITTGDKVMVANGFYTADCVFGLMFGRGAKAIAEQYGITRAQAEEVRDLFFERYPKAARWLEKQIAFAHEFKYVKTGMGRFRRLPEIDSDNDGVRAEAERQARNSPIQGQVSNMNDHYMVTSLKQARKQNIQCYPSVTQHDAQIFLVKDIHVQDMIKVMKSVVDAEFPEFRCRMKLDIEVGKTLGTLEKIA